MLSTISQRAFRQTLLQALFVLFFIQLLTTWIESIFRMSLTRLSIGGEIYGLLWVLAPIALVACPIRWERAALLLAMTTVLMTRAVCPLLSTSALIVNAGIGVSASFVILCFALSRGYRQLGDQLAMGVGLGVLMSVALRTWGASCDLSLEGTGVVLGWALVALAGCLAGVAIRDQLASGPSPTEEIPRGRAAMRSTTLAAVGWFGNTAIIYWMLSSPAVISAWSGSHHAINTVLLAAAWAIAIAWGALPLERLSRTTLWLWNLAFSGVLLFGIFLQLVDYPLTEGTAPLLVLPSPALRQIPFYLAIVLSPVILANALVLLRQPRPTRPRALVLPIIFGASLLIATTLVYIFTNTWGYVGEFGIAFRGKFYLPYAVACLAMVLPLLLFSAKDSARVLPTVSSCGVAASAVVLALLVGVGLAVQVARMPDAGRQEKRLTILTYNLCMGSHKNGERNLQDQLNLLRQIDADVIGLQESDTARPQTGNIDVSRYYARALGYQVYFGPTSISGTYGTAILSRYPLRRTRTIFTYSTVDEIGTAVAEIEVAGTTIVLINSHPAGNAAAHHAHTDAVLEVAESYDHVIAMGDFNCRQDSAYYGKLAGTLQDSWLACYPDAKGPRHPVIGTPPGRPTPVDELLDMTGRIDHVFLSAGFKVESSYFVPVPESRTDHPAYWTTVRWE